MRSPGQKAEWHPSALPVLHPAPGRLVANGLFPPQVVKPSGVHLKLVLRFQDFGKAMFKPMR